MDAAEFRAELEEAMVTELDRMGSSKALMWTTAGDLDPDEVLRAAADAERRAAETFAAWSADADGARATALFDEMAETEREHGERVDAEPATDEPDALHRHLRGLDGTVERIAAGLVGRCLVTDATLSQTVSFFVGRAQRSLADTFRAIREENEEMLERGLGELEHHCETEEDWERAAEAAEAAIEVAYDDYAETLEGIGVNPKPVC